MKEDVVSERHRELVVYKSLIKKAQLRHSNKNG